MASPPPVARSATPPARNPPTQTVFAWGPGAVGIHTTNAMNYCDSFHSWAGGGHWRVPVTGICCPRYGRWITDHPGPTTHENCIFVGPGIAVPLRRGELYSATIRAKFPSVGGAAACRRGGKRVRNYPLSPLICHSRAGGNRAWIVISYLIWEVYSVLYFHPPAIRGTI